MSKQGVQCGWGRVSSEWGEMRSERRSKEGRCGTQDWGGHCKDFGFYSEIHQMALSRGVSLLEFML